MFTFLGASAETTPEELDSDCFDGAAIVHVEGYLLFNPDLITGILQAAKAAGARVSLDLASFTVVEESRELLAHFMENYVDIVLANEDEARGRIEARRAHRSGRPTTIRRPVRAAHRRRGRPEAG